jgi:ATP-binding cassette subfamily F protein 3
VVLMGRNGTGKTTLLRTLLGQQPPLGGTFRLGHKVAISYYAQGHDALNLDATILDELLRIDPDMGIERARTLLGSFLFSGDDVFKRVGTLSGGERSRVAIAQLMLLPGNLLILDEPTNHLDIDSRETLEAALQDYPGTLLFVSHDRRFIDALADRLWIIEQGSIVEYLGNYTSYTQQLADRRAASAAAAPTAGNGKQQPADASRQPAKDAKEERLRRKRLAALEAEVQALEQELARLNAALEQASAAQDIDQITQLGQEYNDLEARLDQRYNDWAELAA